MGDTVEILRRCCKFIREIVSRMCGEPYLVFRFLTIPIFTITIRDPHHYNFFILFIPVLQVITGPEIYSIDILLFTWLYKSIKYLFTGWSYINTEELTRIAFCGKTIYEEKTIRPYDFPSTKFHDKQV